MEVITIRLRISRTGAILGGGYNLIDSNSAYSAIGGGQSNLIIDANGTSIAGGTGNTAVSNFCFMGAGGGNYVGERYGSIVSGWLDTLTSPYSGIVAGIENRIGVKEEGTGSESSFIGAGDSNVVDAEYGSILGGYQNRIDSFALYGDITGGQNNLLDMAANHSFIGGGRDNYIGGPFGVIGGGDSNTIYANGADHNVIGGGSIITNTIRAMV